MLLLLLPALPAALYMVGDVAVRYEMLLLMLPAASKLPLDAPELLLLLFDGNGLLL
jgi:hypothetical protein